MTTYEMNQIILQQQALNNQNNANNLDAQASTNVANIQAGAQANVANLNNAGILKLAGVNNAAQLQQLLAQLGGQNQNALGLAGVNNASAMQQLLAQIKSQQGIAELQSATTLANTGLQNSGAMGLAGVNNAADLEQLVRSLTSQERISGLNNQNAVQVAGINTQPALQAQQLARDQFAGRQGLLQQILGTDGASLSGLLGPDAGPSPVGVAQGGSNAGDVSSGWLAQLMAGADSQFTEMPQELFQSQLNQILGNAGSALGGQLRSAQGAAGGAGMGALSPVAQALQQRYGTASNAATQNSLTNAFLGKYNTDFQRQQASAGYKTGIGQLGLGQTQANQQFGLGLGNLQLGTLQNTTQRRGQNMGLIGQLTA